MNDPGSALSQPGPHQPDGLAGYDGAHAAPGRLARRRLTATLSGQELDTATLAGLRAILADFAANPTRSTDRSWIEGWAAVCGTYDRLLAEHAQRLDIPVDAPRGARSYWTLRQREAVEARLAAAGYPLPGLPPGDGRHDAAQEAVSGLCVRLGGQAAAAALLDAGVRAGQLPLGVLATHGSLAKPHRTLGTAEPWRAVGVAVVAGEDRALFTVHLASGDDRARYEGRLAPDASSTTWVVAELSFRPHLVAQRMRRLGRELT